MFRGGLSGLIAQARAQREAAGHGATPEQLAFWEALEIVYSAAIALSRRFAALAYQLADRYPEHRARLVAVARACDQVPERAPRTLHEALQFAWFMHELIEMEGERVRSAGHFDRLFLPYYTADLAAGRLTRDQAKELIKHLWFKHYARTRGRENGKNYCLGGQYRDGSEVVNELTYPPSRHKSSRLTSAIRALYPTRQTRCTGVAISFAAGRAPCADERRPPSRRW